MHRDNCNDAFPAGRAARVTEQGEDAQQQRGWGAAGLPRPPRGPEGQGGRPREQQPQPQPEDGRAGRQPGAAGLCLQVTGGRQSSVGNFFVCSFVSGLLIHGCSG